MEDGERHNNIQHRAFEKVYAVFDRDDHASYHDALALAASLDGKLKNDANQLIRFQAIASVPGFELWLLLHFEDIQAPLHRDEVMRRLKTHIPGYSKGASNAFALTKEHLNAQHIAQNSWQLVSPRTLIQSRSPPLPNW